MDVGLLSTFKVLMSFNEDVVQEGVFKHTMLQVVTVCRKLLY